VREKEEFTPIRMFILFISFMMLGCAIVKRQEHPTGQFFYLDSYVADIDTPTYGNDYTRSLLEEFNNMSSTKESVSFKDDHVLKERKIHIKEAEKVPQVIRNEGETTIAITTNGNGKCNIQITKDLTFSKYREVLFHEYCHCFGYPDLYIPYYEHDLMYYLTNDVDDEGIRWYSEDIGLKVNKWKNLRNLNINTEQTK
jgi:hypothetical protein